MQRNDIRFAMMARRLKSKDVAKVLQVAEPQISNILNGKGNPRHRLMCALIELLGENIDATECIAIGSKEYWEDKQFKEEFANWEITAKNKNNSC